jgi:hypothetical protein
MSTRMNMLVSRDDRKEEIRRTLKVLIGIMVLLVAVSVVTIVLKH